MARRKARKLRKGKLNRRSLAAKKGWLTRRRNARSRAAKKGWQTRKRKAQARSRAARKGHETHRRKARERSEEQKAREFILARDDEEEEEEEEPRAAPPPRWAETAKGKVVPPSEYEDTEGAVRFVSPGNMWNDNRPRMEYRKKFLEKSEVIEWVNEIEKSRHVLVVVEKVGLDGQLEYEVWLDYEESVK